MSYVLKPGQVSPNFLRYPWASTDADIEWVADAGLRVAVGTRLSGGTSGEQAGKPGIRFTGDGRTIFVEAEGRPEIARLMAEDKAAYDAAVARSNAIPTPADDDRIVDDGFFSAMGGHRNGWNNPRHDDF